MQFVILRRYICSDDDDNDDDDVGCLKERDKQRFINFLSVNVMQCIYCLCKTLYNSKSLIISFVSSVNHDYQYH